MQSAHITYVGLTLERHWHRAAWMAVCMLASPGRSLADERSTRGPLPAVSAVADVAVSVRSVLFRRLVVELRVMSSDSTVRVMSRVGVCMDRYLPTARTRSIVGGRGAAGRRRTRAGV